VRLFVALEIAPTVRENLCTLIRELREASPESEKEGLRWVRSENLHVTLKFIGTTAPEKLNAIRETLASVRSDQPITLRFGGLGFFPNEKRPRVLWAGMEASQNLGPLAAAIDHGLEELGFPRELRPFTPHLTLARMEGARLSEKFRSAIAERNSRDLGSLRTREFHLIGSKLNPTGAEYSTLQSFEFTPEA